ncbi:hypothetical protein SERLA73DRAFT_86143 [Serpula lacrymans var. lacrymans S7.3]|uniref:Velvet domain-containing protein n=1 Tax=Serpula lacrymans var. lacrymans (strain S7.3) TaxID=936435 RepID=F8PPE1_SERL3|nr:hypothetical protein SERLA73DRAFT_86143 [Serpula lacrymans var. lacrymans S7.3]
MIHRINPRSARPPTPPPRQLSSDSVEHWGQWSGRKHYSLEVVQHPLRARMCGFGDKDRRPLAPAAVAKMVVRREDNSLVDVDDLDYSFFLVTVDLWSADGRKEMNLVLHPSSAERYVPTTHAAKPRRRGTGPAVSTPRNGHQSPTSSHSTPNSTHYQSRLPADQHTAMPMMQPPIQPTYSSQSYPYSQQAPSMQEPMGFTASNPYGSTSDSTPAWGYTPQAPPIDRTSNYQQHPLTSRESFGRSTAQTGIGMATSSTTETWQSDSSFREDTDTAPYRGWPADPSYSSVMETPQNNVYSSPESDPALRPASLQTSSHHDIREAWSQPISTDSTSHQNRYSQEPFGPTPANPFDTTSMYAPPTYSQQSPPTSYYQANYVQSSPPPPPPPSSSNNPPLPRHSYTRTLVGPLSANACRLLDEHRKPGIFFLFQDLSVRTEGTFRLRLRLMNVGAPPAPEAGALRVHTDMSPVLAQTFTEPFVVYSAKRFPGVPDTTALSIAFGNQGQKLPLVRSFRPV